MRIEDIKNKILTLAIQGKLVPQNPSDEAATVLLERIKAEKEQLIKEKKIKKEKPLPEIGEEEKGFEVPDGWEWCRINDIYRFIDYRGKTPTKIEQGIPFVTAKNVRMGYIDYTIEEFISEEEFEDRKTRGISQKGDILFTTEAPMGNVAIADLDIFSAGQRLITFQQYTKQELLINKLFMYFIMSKFFQDELMENKTGTTVYGIKAEKLKKLLVPVPPLQEQHRIVSKVEELFKIVDELEENKEAMLENIAVTRNKVLQLAIEGKLTEQEEGDEPASVLLEKIAKEKEQLIKEKKIKKEKLLPEILEEEKKFEVPKGWEFIRLGDFIRFVGGNQPPKSTFKYEYQEGYIRLIQIRDYKSDSHITYIPIDKAKRFCDKDDIMIGRYGPPIFQILRGIEGAYNVALMKADPIAGIEKDYLFYLLKDHKLLRKLEYLASRTCGQDGIDMDTLREYVVGLPPLSEQHRIVSKVDEIMEYLNSLEKTILDEEII